jgi:hypothetical protein
VTDYQDPDWFDSDYQPIPHSYCDKYVVEEPHIYVAINGGLYSCPGLTADQLAELEAYDPGTCEHGLNADLCYGPMHYPPDLPY